MSNNEEVPRAEKEMRKLLGDETVDGMLRLAEQRSAFKTDLTNAVEGGKSGREMAEFLNNHAWLWTYVYDDVESDPQYQAMIERALSQCTQTVPIWRRWLRMSAATHHVPNEWRRAEKMVDENRQHVAALQKKFSLD